MKTALWIGILFSIGCAKPGDGKIPVTVEKVLVEETSANLSLPAALEPANKAVYTFPMEVKVEAVPVRLGEVVPQGGLLLELDPLDLSLKMAGLKAKRQEVRAGLDKNKYFLENRERLLEEGKIDQIQYDVLEMEVSKSEAQWEKLNSEISLIEKQIGEAAIRAPFTGIVAALEAAAGTRVPAGEKLLTLVQTNPIAVVFHLPAAESAGAATGMPVEIVIEGFGEKTFTAPVTFISPELDAANRTLEARAELPNSGYLFKGGQQAQVRFTSRQPRKRLSIPVKAILKEGEKEYVYILRQNRAWPAAVTTDRGTERPEMAEVLSGLKETDLVVVEGQENLTEGVEVNLWR